MSMIGVNRVLWRTEFSLSAYKDQFGKEHSGYIVLEEYPVTIIETQKVKGMWGDGDYEGWKAITSQGRWFTCNWHSYPDDAMTPTYYWDVVKDESGLWQPEDAEQAYNSGIVHARQDGSRAIPAGMVICTKHDVGYIPPDTCYKCDFDVWKEKKSQKDGG